MQVPALPQGTVFLRLDLQYAGMTSLEWDFTTLGKELWTFWLRLLMDEERWSVSM